MTGSNTHLHTPFVEDNQRIQVRSCKTLSIFYNTVLESLTTVIYIEWTDALLSLNVNFDMVFTSQETAGFSSNISTNSLNNIVELL